jgi:hypothetical protein
MSTIMKKLNKIKTIILLGIACLSCDSWLTVKPEDKIMEEILFEEVSGFLNSLNGVYAGMNVPALYGENLSMGAIDVMGQYYDCRGSSSLLHNFSDFYIFPSRAQANDPLRTITKKFAEVWSNAYSLINNCNILIEHCGDGNPVLPNEYYRLVKGEVLALRAMLHFDMLRIFGPVWEFKTEPAIPYVEQSARVIQPILPAEEVLERVIRDLVEASSLLETVDPVLTDGARNYGGAEMLNGNDWNYRQNRLNYFAVRTLLARAYLWDGDKAKAGEVARDVIARANAPVRPFFPLTLPGITTLTDRMFSQEVLFALHNTSRENTFDALFSEELELREILAAAGDVSTGRVAHLYDNISDYRYQMWEPRVVKGVALTCFFKYEDVDSIKYRYMIPLVRLSENYLIAAECETNMQVALDKYLNPLRMARNCTNLTAVSMDDVTELVAAEYAREFAGEGQLFFMYKRRAQTYSNIPDGSPDGILTVRNTEFQIPLPKSETDARVE